jgi:hypothetical protein
MVKLMLPANAAVGKASAKSENSITYSPDICSLNLTWTYMGKENYLVGKAQMVKTLFACGWRVLSLGGFFPAKYGHFRCS